MREQTWTDLLGKLVAGTEDRKVKWHSTDGRGVYVAAFANSSVRIRDPRASALTEAFHLGKPPTVVELRDADGEMTDSLETPSSLVPPFRAEAFVKPQLAGLEVSTEEHDDYQPHSTATDRQADLIEMLLIEVKKSMTIGESLARDIIDEI